MRFSLFLLPIALTYSLGVVDRFSSSDNIADDFENLDLENYDNNPGTPLNRGGRRGRGGQLIAGVGDGLSFWNTGGAVVDKGLTSFLDSVFWAGSAIGALVGLEGLNPQPMERMSQGEKEAYINAEIAKVKELGCEKAHWGRVFCALGREGPWLMPGVLEYVFDVYPIARGQCVNPSVKPPSYCCSNTQAMPMSSDYTRYTEMGVSCIPLG